MLLASKKATLLTAVAAAGLLVVLALVLIGSRAESTHAAGPAQKFAVLADAGAPGQVESAKAKSWATRLETPPGGGGTVSALAVTHLPNGDEAGVATAGTEVCVADLAKGSGTCGALSQATSGGSFVATPEGCGNYYVVGLAPDGVNTLSVDIGADGAVDRKIPVKANTYSVSLPSVETALSSSDGLVQVNLPLDWYAADNDAC